MDKRQLQALLKVDLRLLNPQITARLRKKGSVGDNLTKKLELQFLINGAIFLFILGVPMLSLNLSKFPGTFSLYVSLSILLAFLRSISGIYNIFFASKDLISYLPLPFREQEIFFSKIMIIVLDLIPFTLPMLLAFFLTAWYAGMIIPIAILLSVGVFILIIAIILMICSLVIFGLTKTKFFQKNPNAFMNSLIAASLIIAMSVFFFINSSSNPATQGFNFVLTPIFLPLFKMFLNPISIGSTLTGLILIGTLFVLGIAVKLLVLPGLNDQLTKANSAFSKKSIKRKSIHRRDLNKILDFYNRQLLKEPNVLLQVFSSSILPPLIFIFTFAMIKGPTDLPVKWLGVFFVGGLLMGILTTNETSLVGNLISLDRMNFKFVKSLPISMNRYLYRKFLLGFVVQLLINLIIMGIVAVVMQIGLIMSISLVLGVTLGTYFMSQYYFTRDYRLRLANWTNISELFNRGAGNIGLILSMMAIIFLGVVVIASYSMAVIFIPQIWLLNLGVFVLIGIAAIIIIHHYQLKFWHQFE
ncbi:ABC transporter [Lactobacillus halodurans]|uniref:ABC transporter n=1 Tax=Companilactobacillus halodurans TaxID=2584183 RepID=A0A5P0ZPW9_9LACO|nr:ABC transporter [Companilactobacillus halodurans]MQS76115.1 ABC transporter [Companilactobacillus halodurans]